MDKKRINYLKKVKLIQEEFSKHDDGTRTITAIWSYFIFPVYHISLATLRRHLSIKVNNELKKLENVQSN